MVLGRLEGQNMKSPWIQLRSVSILPPAVAGLLTLLCGSVLATEPPVPAQGHTYLVSPSGSDDNSGFEAEPWTTPGYGSR